jgi:hypothetical protein
MSQSLTLPDELYDKLARGAAVHGLTVEELLTFVSELVVVPNQPTEHDRQRSRRIERLLDKYRTGSLTEQDRAKLDQLIDTDYQEAIKRADGLIAAKEDQADTPQTPKATAPQVRSSPKPAKRSRS